MSTFSGLNGAFRGLTAARIGVEVVGQNIANANTEGYTRQRIVASSVASAQSLGAAATGVRAGEGVSVDGIARLGDDLLDNRVRTTSSSAGYWAARADAATTLEASLREPGKTGLSAQLDDFWAAWQDLANRPGEAAPSTVLLEQAATLAARISSGHNEMSSQWAALRSKVDSSVTSLNDSAGQIAELNRAIRTALVSGASASELIDKRSTVLTTVARLAGSTTLARVDGTVDVYLGGNPLVSGDQASTVIATGSRLIDGVAAAPVRLEWAARPGAAIALDGGTIAGSLSVLAPASGGIGGTIAEAAASYDAIATSLAAQVNAIHSSGATGTGATGLDFFRLTAGVPAARGLTVVPTDAAGIASAKVAGGPRDGSIADAISALATGPGTPTDVWITIVAGIGTSTRSSLQQAEVSGLTADAALGRQLASASVDSDEENVTLLTYQTAYQAAARVMTTIDEMLDTLINRVGIVGR